MRTCQKLRCFLPFTSAVHSKYSPNDWACSSKRSFILLFTSFLFCTFMSTPTSPPLHFSPKIPLIVLVRLGSSGQAFCSLSEVKISYISPIFWVPSSHSLLAMLSWSSTGKFISVSSPPSFKCILYPHGLISEKHSRQLTIFWYQPMNTLSLPLPGGISVLEGTDEVRDNDSRYNF